MANTIPAAMPPAGLRLAVPDEQLEWLLAALARGVDHLPVTYDSRT